MIVPAGVSSYFNSTRDHKTSRTQIAIALVSSAAEELGSTARGEPELQSVFETRDATIAHIVGFFLKSCECRRILRNCSSSVPPRTPVFSHGWPLNADAWDSQMLFLTEQGYRCIAHDRRGHRRSDQPAAGNDVDTYADDLAALTEHLDLTGCYPRRPFHRRR